MNFLGAEIRPEAAQTNRVDIPLTVEGVEDEITLTVIEWVLNVERALHICDETSVSLDQVPPGIQAPGFSFTAYLNWTGFREHHAMVQFGAMAEDPIPRIMTAAKDALRTHFKERAAQRGAELVQAWKDDRTYPYSAVRVSLWIM